MRGLRVFTVVLGIAAVVAPLSFMHADNAPRQKCERARDDKRASCLQAITDKVMKCQRACLSDANQTTCERQCQDPEPSQRAECYAEEKATVCD